ncbi:hypothetical protein [Streptomyces litchfieldiae]|uniref:Uncharacterized protein n=1 Tax=Streptomyces litchfieldiae TaxID=3075543 RepID=A0ABU2MNA0_9ACTN|nr:hypothetical protein [Streptomyces sp. DSM 44938]MDT0343084.1 hypothetical protein [Streptomyces sp. DSM 44938]
MPGAGGGDRPRFVVDESSFDFRGLGEERLTDLLDDFCDVLEELGGRWTVMVSPWWTETECADGQPLFEVLYENGVPRPGRDARLRMVRLMDRCPAWSPDLSGLPDRVEVAGIVRDMAWSIGYAWRQARDGHHTCCLVFPGPGPRGWQPVTATTGPPPAPATAAVHFLAALSAHGEFWRSLFTREDVTEQDFLHRVREAFPGLAFADSLTFRKFDGTYRELRDWVVHALSVIHDHFADALHGHAGIPHQVQAALGRHGIDVSPESPKTRASRKLMKQREVTHEGEVYECEWHAKKDRHRNRVHFSLPDPRLEGRLLIGIFTDHLPTE